MSNLKPSELYNLMADLDTEMRRDPNCMIYLVEIAGMQPDGKTIAVNPARPVTAMEKRYVRDQLTGSLKTHSIPDHPLLVFDKEQITMDDHTYTWIAEWPGAPGSLFYRTVSISTERSLHTFLTKAEATMDNNTGPMLMVLGAMVSMLDYRGIMEKIGHFNLPICFGPPMSGKTLAATCAGMVLGITRSQLSSRNTLAFLSDYFTTSTFPFIWDDPTKEAEVKQVAVNLGDGVLRGKTSKEECRVPMIGCLITANFNLAEITKYYSRICLIKFHKVEKVKISGEGPDLQKVAEEASSYLPTLIGMTTSTTAAEIRAEVTTLQKVTDTEIDVRILEGIAVPVVIARKILQLAGADTMGQHLERFVNKATEYHQGSAPAVNAMQSRDAVTEVLSTTTWITVFDKAACYPIETGCFDNYHKYTLSYLVYLFPLLSA